MSQFTTADPAAFRVANRGLQHGSGRNEKGLDSYLADIYL
jgi:hypothetical protein